MPNHTILATMKNEAPFILEWVAYHQIIGFDKFVIFSNDSSDGTTEILDALDRAGIINHYFHQKADSEVLDHSIPKKAADTGAFANDDWVIWLDADEFLNIHVGGGVVGDLTSFDGSAQGICVGWRLFGDSGQSIFRGRKISPDFSSCANEGVGWLNVKTLFKYGAGFSHFFNHKPMMTKAFWDDGGYFLNASGQPMQHNGELLQRWRNGKPRGKVDGVDAGWKLAQINHYAVRTKPLFEHKRRRGTAGENPNRYNWRYFRGMNFNTARDETILRWQTAVDQQIAMLLDQTGLRETYAALIGRSYAPDVVDLSGYPLP